MPSFSGLMDIMLAHLSLRLVRAVNQARSRTAQAQLTCPDIMYVDAARKMQQEIHFSVKQKIKSQKARRNPNNGIIL
jgi:hypothetical protein